MGPEEKGSWSLRRGVCDSGSAPGSDGNQKKFNPHFNKEGAETMLDRLSKKDYGAPEQEEQQGGGSPAPPQDGGKFS